jgi:hypothetical protein
VYLHPAAIKAAESAPLRDVSLAYRALAYLADHYVPMRERSHDDAGVRAGSDAALSVLGLTLARTGRAPATARFREEYRRLVDGKVHVLDQHLKRGAGADPAACFRLYFTYDADNRRVIVGHLPTHLTNYLTN